MPLEKMAAAPWLESGATNSRVAYEGVRIPEGSPPVYREDEPLQLKRRTNQQMREAWTSETFVANQTKRSIAPAQPGLRPSHTDSELSITNAA